MSLRDLRFDEVDEAALQSLVENQVRESLTLDFKETLPGKSDQDKRELLKDVTAFANADGGDLLFGVGEDDGVAARLPGVSSDSLDTEVQRLSSLLRDAIDPRLHGVNIQVVKLPSGTSVLHVRVPRSLEAPHMVQLGSYRQFFTRNPSGNHPMSTNEVRQAVLRVQDWKSEADAWRRHRTALIAANEAPVLLQSGGAAVVHVIPMPTASMTLDLSAEATTKELGRMAPREARGWNDRMTFDGYLVARGLPGTGEENFWYRLWFHDGPVEMVMGGIVQSSSQLGHLVSGRDIEEFLRESVTDALAVKSPGGPRPPLLVFLSILGVEGSYLVFDGQARWGEDETPFDRDALLVPPLFMEGEPTDMWAFLSPAVNRFWQAAGRHRSPFLNADGTRRQQR